MEADNRQPHDARSMPSLHLNDAERRAIIAFLHTLTDEHFIAAEQFSNPFVHRGVSSE